jgi:hypothetical protein
MRRTAIIFAIAALLFGSAAYGSKKPRVSTVSATSSHKKAPHSAKRAASRSSAHSSSFSHRFHFRHAVKTVPVRKLAPPQETAAAPDPPEVVESASLRKSRVAMPTPLRGSYESLVRQNERSEAADGLERIEDDDDLADRIAGGMLVPVPVSAALNINGNLPENRRYCRPWTATFLSDLARAHAAEFHTPLLVTSAVRTVEYQKRLGRVNGNAAAAEGDIASPHLTGGTIDIAKQGLSRQEVAWMRARLLPLQDAGKIDVAEEFQQSCFHITVYKSYAPPNPERNAPVQATAAPATEQQSQTSKAILKRKKTGHRKPAKATPDQPKPVETEPERQTAPAPPAEAPVEGL